MNITQNLQRWGNSTGVRLPKKVLDAAHLEVDQPMSISLKGRSIVLTPIDVPAGTVSLTSLLSGVTPDNLHCAVDWGDPVGKEAW